MANCILSLLAGIWSFILGSLRMILFFGCLIFAIFQAVWLLLLFYSTGQQHLNLPELTNITNLDFIHAFVLLFVALLGCYGSFYKKHGAIQVFSFANALSVILTISTLMMAYRSGEAAHTVDKYTSAMKEQMKAYDWYGQGSEPEERTATIRWNSLQSLGCCGMDKPQDWDQYRPSSISKNQYPKTCCFSGVSNKFCDKHDVFKTGCIDEIHILLAIEVYSIIAFIAFQTLLCVIGYMVGCCSPRQEQHTRSSAGLLSSNANLSNEYRRYDGSVYIRSPPTEYGYQQANAPMDKMPVTNLYPNLNDQRGFKANSPPPRYGSGY